MFKQMKPIISVIVPVYNVERFLTKCLDSILNQTFSHFELILVNDGSTDSSGQICNYYLSKDSRVKVINKENGGLSSARNAGIIESIGLYISFVDSDDWIEKSMFEILYNFAIKFNVDLVACNINRVFKNKVKRLNKSKKDITLDRYLAMKNLFKNDLITFSAVNKLYKRSLFKDLKFKEGIIYEDIDIMYQIIHITNTIFYTSTPLYNYRYNENSITTQKFSLKHLDSFYAKKRMYSFFIDFYPNLVNEMYGELLLDGFYLFCKIKQSKNYNLNK
jgi:glycosyltransferase involved in cell wall biosynthesis